ncbi:hypothetical protein FQN54_006147 [Arachnomyces sp. PD_36]|nr:hypothetical protein FQN54_006147 [Arachnomyces sp. PD_36]
MNISGSCRSFSIEHFKTDPDNWKSMVTDFHCEARKDNGDWVATKIRLDDFLGNRRGEEAGVFSYSVRWPEHKVSETMSKPRLEITSNGRPILHGNLKVKEGDWPAAKLDLSEIILNNDGELSFNEAAAREEDARRWAAY